MKKYEFYVSISELQWCVDFFIFYLGKTRAKNLTQIYNMFWKIKLDSKYIRIIACWEYYSSEHITNHFIDVWIIG